MALNDITINKGKGGFWMGMTIASFAGGAVTFLADKLWK